LGNKFTTSLLIWDQDGTIHEREKASLIQLRDKQGDQATHLTEGEEHPIEGKRAPASLTLFGGKRGILGLEKGWVWPSSSYLLFLGGYTLKGDLSLGCLEQRSSPGGYFLGKSDRKNRDS